MSQPISAEGWLLTQVRQCAWCCLVMDLSGAYSIQPGHKLMSATHGICPACKATLKAEIDASSAVLIAA